MGDWLIRYFFYIPNKGSNIFQNHMRMAAMTATKRRAKILCPGVGIIMVMILLSKLYFCLLHRKAGGCQIAAGNKSSS